MNKVILHPFLLGAFPILFLFAHNARQFSLDVVAMPIAMSWLIALLGITVLGIILRDLRKAALVVSLFLLLFFSYGHIYNVLADTRLVLFGVSIGAHELLFPVFGSILLVSSYVLLKLGANLGKATGGFNVVAGFLVSISVVNIAVAGFSAEKWSQSTITSPTGGANPQVKIGPDGRPDIYYIVLDGYGRADILEDLYDFDNSEWLSYLEEKGFYIANDSRANYSQTALALASSLNGAYLDELIGRMHGTSEDRKPLMGLIKNNFASEFLRELGYTHVAFASGYEVTEIENANIYRSPGWFSDEFLSAVFSTTPVPAVVGKIADLSPYDLHRRRIMYILDHLPDRIGDDGPQFIFAHVVAPHPPFVFGPNGEELNPRISYIEQGDGDHLIRTGGITRGEYIRRYRDQLKFINEKLVETIDRIVENSPRRPIIILQADHGPGSLLVQESVERTYLKERLTILNALLLPGVEGSELYDGISPVNTFRIIFNLYFGTQYELLEDRSYFSAWTRPYEFIDVTDLMGVPLEETAAG
ncbi:MAG: hypothetical protein ACE5JL_01290 [Dehalococcoidia bacterium]